MVSPRTVSPRTNKAPSLPVAKSGVPAKAMPVEPPQTAHQAAASASSNAAAASTEGRLSSWFFGSSWILVAILLLKLLLAAVTAELRAQLMAAVPPVAYALETLPKATKASWVVPWLQMRRNDRRPCHWLWLWVFAGLGHLQRRWSKIRNGHLARFTAQPICIVTVDVTGDMWLVCVWQVKRIPVMQGSLAVVKWILI